MPVFKKETNQRKKQRPPATTPEARENQLISMAVDLVEERMLNKTASSQEIVHFLRLGSTKERLEKEILEQQKDLIKAKTEALQASKKVEELYLNALNAMRTYSGQQGVPDDEE